MAENTSIDEKKLDEKMPEIKIGEWVVFTENGLWYSSLDDD